MCGQLPKQNKNHIIMKIPVSNHQNKSMLILGILVPSSPGNLSCWCFFRPGSSSEVDHLDTARQWCPADRTWTATQPDPAAVAGGDDSPPLNQPPNHGKFTFKFSSGYQKNENKWWICYVNTVQSLNALS